MSRPRPATGAVTISASRSIWAPTSTWRRCWSRTGSRSALAASARADVRQIGVPVAKPSTDLMMVVHMLSPDKSRSELFISNYAALEVKDALTRVQGVGSIIVFGSRDYSMRVWLDPQPAAIARHDGK